MSGKMYVIRWKSKANGRVGQGSRLFDRRDAEELIAELNTEFPDIHHELAEAPPNDLAKDQDPSKPREHALSE